MSIGSAPLKNKGDFMAQGYLKIQLYVGDFTFHGDITTVLVKKNGEILHTLQTDENGKTEVLTLICPDITADSPSSGTTLFRTYDVEVPAAHGFMHVKICGVQVFDGLTTVANIRLEPYVEGGPADIEITIPEEHGVDIDRDNGAPEIHESEEILPVWEPDKVPSWITDPQPPPPITSLPTPQRVLPDPVATNIPLANEVVVPEFITVHLGLPNNTNARNVRVAFMDYIINVCCSEIYPTWHRNAIEANVHAQVSFALNRLFTVIWI